LLLTKFIQRTKTLILILHILIKKLGKTFSEHPSDENTKQT